MVLFTLAALLWASVKVALCLDYRLRVPPPPVHRCAQQTSNGQWRLRPSATMCEDELPLAICGAVFVRQQHQQQQPELRPPACDNQWIQPLAHKCRRSCGTCCELGRFSNCQNKRKRHHQSPQNREQFARFAASTGQHSVDCDRIHDLAHKCKQTSVWHPILIEHCASSCGLCEEAAKLEERERTKKHESDSGETGNWTRLIPRVRDCRNAESDAYCNHAQRLFRCHEPKIHRRCNKMCGVCFPLDAECKDKHPRKCKVWARNGFCAPDSERHPLAAQLHYCAKRCRLCRTRGSASTADGTRRRHTL